MSNEPKTPQKFSDVYGAKFEEDRYKLDKGIKFTLTQIVEIKESLKKNKSGQPYEICIINGEDISGNPVKYYATNYAIANQCKEMLKDCNREGFLKVPIIVTVVQKTSPQGKYLAFE